MAVRSDGHPTRSRESHRPLLLVLIPFAAPLHLPWCAAPDARDPATADLSSAHAEIRRQP
jgi:hypothetical protein